ncbi:hypothetical protein DIZ76_016795 [Coccidioides immitis]|nr:hypothetical protein DIZ76_016795 [Coccidioides immitis]
MAVSLPPAPAVYLLLVSLPLLVISETNSFLTGHALFKMLSSAAFVGAPLLHLSAESSPYNTFVTYGLLFSVLGDFLLIPSRNEYYILSPAPAAKKNNGSNPTEPEEPKISISFQLGVVAFAAAHIAYILAFLQNSPEDISWPSFAITFVTTMVIARWLGVIYPSPASSNALNLVIPKDMLFLVLIYAAIISSMLAVAVSTVPSLQHQRVLGAAMFVVSDIFVAKDAFGKRSRPKNERNWWLQSATGWGLYFWGQMVLAGTVEGI